jgi:hypothetical protein
MAKRPRRRRSSRCSATGRCGYRRAARVRPCARAHVCEGEVLPQYTFSPMHCEFLVSDGLEGFLSFMNAFFATQSLWRYFSSVW